MVVPRRGQHELGTQIGLGCCCYVCAQCSDSFLEVRREFDLILFHIASHGLILTNAERGGVKLTQFNEFTGLLHILTNFIDFDLFLLNIKFQNQTVTNVAS